MDLWEILVVDLEVTVKFIVLWVVEECDPLFVDLILDHVRMQEVPFQWEADRAEELVVLLILHDDTHNFLRLRTPQWHHHSVWVVQIAHVDKLHIAVDVETNFFLFFAVSGS